MLLSSCQCALNSLLLFGKTQTKHVTVLLQLVENVSTLLELSVEIINLQGHKGMLELIRLHQRKNCCSEEQGVDSQHSSAKSSHHWAGGVFCLTVQF